MKWMNHALVGIMSLALLGGFSGCGDDTPDPLCHGDVDCNDDPSISSVHGTCNTDGTCTCFEGFAKNPDTGKCL